jgi:hypothetical protein
MMRLLSRPARLLRRAAIFSLAYLAVLVVPSLAEAAGPRAAGSEETVDQAGEPVSVLSAIPAGGAEDRDDLVMLPLLAARAAAIPCAALRVRPLPVDAPRATLLARPAARGPPHRA